MPNSRTTNYELAWFDDFDLLRKYVSTNPPESRLIRFTRQRSVPNPPTYTAIYLIEQLDDPEFALANYNRAISINPNDACACYNRAVLKQENFGDIEGAEADFNTAIALDRTLILAFNMRGSILDSTTKQKPGVSLVQFKNGDAVNWINYEKYHYILDAETDLFSPVMQNVFNTHARKLGID